MPSGPEKIPRELWLYVILLSLAVVALWSFFWPKEFTASSPSDGKNLGRIVGDFFNSVGGKNRPSNALINEAGLPATTANNLINQPDLVEKFSSKIEEALWQKRVQSWPIWSGKLFRCQLPAGWIFSEDNGVFFLQSGPAAAENNRAEIKISSAALSPNVSFADWQKSNIAKNAPTTTVNIGGLIGVRQISEGFQGPTATHTQILWLPQNQQLIKIETNIWGDSPLYLPIINDFLKTIIFLNQ